MQDVIHLVPLQVDTRADRDIVTREYRKDTQLHR
jgi:hypothetical protein